MNHSDARLFFEHIVEKAEEMYILDLGELDLVFDAKPKSKNVLAFYKYSTKSVHLSDVLLETIDYETIQYIIIHEIAHHITPIVAPYHKQAHGPEFKRIDRSLGGLGKTKMSVDNHEAFAIKSSSRKVSTVTYNCSCMKHEITKNRHTRILKGSKYICSKCNTRLTITS